MDKVPKVNVCDNLQKNLVTYETLVYKNNPKIFNSSYDKEYNGTQFSADLATTKLSPLLNR